MNKKNTKQKEIPTSPLGFVFYVTKSHRHLLFFLILTTLAVEAFAAINPLVLGKLIDAANDYAAGGPSTIETVGFFVLLFPFVRLMVSLSIRTAAFILHYLTLYMRTGAYRILFGHLSQHSDSYFSDRFAGSLSSDVHVVARNMVRMMNFFTWSFLTLLLGIITSFWVMATASVTIAVIFVLGLFVLIPINYYLSKPTMRLAKDAIKTLSKLRGQVVDAITNIVTVHQFARIKHEKDRIDESIVEHQKADIKADVYSEKVITFNNVIVVLFVGALIYGAFILWSDSVISLGQFVMVATLASTFIRAMSHVGNSINEFASMYSETKQTLSEILVPHEIVDAPEAKPINVTEGAVEFEDVSFKYGDSDTSVFANLSLKIEPGQKVGIVGPSGGGKTTLMKILLRQYELSSGSIKIDGQNIVDCTLESLRSAVSVVPQDPSLFHRTIQENISYGKAEASIEEVKDAAKKAQIDEFIETLQKKYETMVGERGIKLSGGQRQRVAIARAFVKAAPILVLDEATSSLDSESEVAIQNALHKLMQNRTVIAVAHRLSTIKEMDRVLVVENGKVVQDGPHDELLKDEKGTYARLWNHQAGGFIKSENE